MEIVILLVLIVLSVLMLVAFLTLLNRNANIERLVLDQIAKNRDELSQNLKSSSDSLLSRFTDLTKMNEDKLEKVREAVERRLETLQQDNSLKLEKMRETVDEKLHSTLERRLGESFKIVSERLEQVQSGLGEMKTLASDVGDLKKVLTNVKTRGILGEVQLETLLEEILTTEQYEKNIATKKGSRDTVEFAIKLPGKEREAVFLPIDAKFPIEDYEKLLAAMDQANKTLIEEAGKSLENRIKGEAKNIREKYIDSPRTTDFAILFLPFEGLYAEVLRRPGLVDAVRRDTKIIVAGPTTIAALLNSLQLGFRTLAVEKRAGEIWNLLAGVKTEFGKFGDILEKTHDKLRQASDTIEEAARKSRTIEKKLRQVQELPNQNPTPSLENDNSDETL
jgi:DNA recombination protein RmuC